MFVSDERHVTIAELLGCLQVAADHGRGSVRRRRRARSRRTQRWHSPSTVAMLWLTNRTVRPSPATSPIFPRHFFWKAASPTASTSSTNEDLGLEVGGDGEPEAHLHAARVALDGRVEELLDLRELDDLVELAGDLGPPHAEDRAAQVDVLAAGQLGVEAGADLEQGADAAPQRRRCPRVGSVIRERILSRVVLPAPLRPMTPTTSPWRTSNETSRSAQIHSRRLATASPATIDRRPKGARERLGQAPVAGRAGGRSDSACRDLRPRRRRRSRQITSAKVRSTRRK